MRRGEDLFGLQSHFSNWLSSETDEYDVIMVRYERMWEPDVCSVLLRLLCGAKKSEAEIEVMTEAFCRGRRARQSEVCVRVCGGSRRARQSKVCVWGGGGDRLS